MEDKTRPCRTEWSARARARLPLRATAWRARVYPLGALLFLSLVVVTAACETSSATPPVPGRPPDATTGPTEAPAALPTAQPSAQPTAPSNASPNELPTAVPSALPPAEGNQRSNIEEANERFRNEGHDTILILVDASSTGIEGEIYRDLMRRDFRATTGPDEGIDTRPMPCYPNCLFVLREEANASTVEGWLGVIRHEYRHIVQARNNPNMASDFRDANGRFTPYAAFSEVCADYGLNVAMDYGAQERMDELKSVLGSEHQALIDRACEGNKPAYEELPPEFNRRRGSAQAFEQLFPPYD